MVYLDYNATTPVLPAVLERMLPYFSERFGNPSSGSHAYGWAARAAVEAASESVARLISAEPRDLVFTSGATEALNMAIKGIAASRSGGRIVTVPTEHKAVLDTCAAVSRQGFDVDVLSVDRRGRIDLAELEATLRDDTVLVAVMWANNETGTVAPIEQISSVVRQRRIPLLTDATQAVGKIPVSVEHVDLLACSAHKLYGPKGVGALWIRPGRDGIRLPRFVDGGGQQANRRGGTLNVPGIVGFGAAADVAADLEAEGRRLAGLRDRFEAALLAGIPETSANGDAAARLPQTTSVTFAGVAAAKLMAEMRSVAASNASACQSDSGRPSHVLKAMGLTDAEAAATIRFSLGRPTTEAEVDEALTAIREAWNRAASPKKTPAHAN